MAKLISFIYRFPLNNIIDASGRGTFQITYNVYTLILAISTAGIPAALSRMVSSANASGNTKLGKRYFTVALPAFIIIGLVAMLVMFFFADDFASLLNNSYAAPGIRVLAPAVFFACIISVYRGYAQGHGNMIPTAVSQITEVICKAVIGIIVAGTLVNMGYETHLVSAGAITGVTIGLGLSVPILIWYKRKSDRGLVLSDGAAPDTRSAMGIFGSIMRVSVPITMTAAMMSLMVNIDSAIVLGRLQSVLGYTETEASSLFGVYALGLTLYNLPPAIVVPVSVSIIPAIAAAITKGKPGEAGEIMQSSLKLVNLIAMPASAGLMVLAAPILKAVYDYDLQLATTILIILGAASFFVCLQYITTSMLQANGFEKVALITFPIGIVIRIILSYVLSGNPDFGILASPIGTLVYFIVVSALNIAFIIYRVKDRPRFSKVFFKPLVCAAVMAGAAFGTYQLVFALGSGILGTGRAPTALFLIISIAAGIAVYGVLIAVTRTITLDDLKLVPKGASFAKLLRIKA
jgi:stage V sporulation protein B